MITSLGAAKLLRGFVIADRPDENRRSRFEPSDGCASRRTACQLARPRARTRRESGRPDHGLTTLAVVGPVRWAVIGTAR
jgi:hypothetical protein